MRHFLTSILSIGVFLFGLVYTIGLSALGGFLGNSLKQDTDVEV